TPWRASSRAHAIPTGPAPTTSTGTSSTGLSGAGLPGTGATGIGSPGIWASGVGTSGRPLPAGRGGCVSLGARIAVRSAVLQRVPDLAVALCGPDAWPLDAVQLVPQPLHVERQAVLEDRPVAVRRGQRPVRRLERLPQPAAAGVHRTDLSAQRAEEPAGLPD